MVSPSLYAAFISISVHLSIAWHTLCQAMCTQTISNPSNLPNTHTHSYPLDVPPILLSLLVKISLSLPASVYVCVCLSLVLLCWLQTPAVCLCSEQAQTHSPSPACSRQWVSKTCHPTRPLCRMPGWTAHTNNMHRTAIHTGCMRTYRLGNCPKNIFSISLADIGLFHEHKYLTVKQLQL